MTWEPGDVVWVDFGDTVGREQRGERPAVVIGTPQHVRTTRGLVIVVPCTSRSRRWRSHLPLVGAVDITRPTFAMTEQPRTVSLERVGHYMGSVHARCRQEIALAVRGWIAQPPALRR